MSKTKLTGFKELNQKIAESIKDEANVGAIDRIVNKRVEVEVIRRADILEKALDKYNTTRKELEKCKADVITYSTVGDSDTPVKCEAWSENALKNKTKIQKLVADFDIAFMKAFEAETDKINEGYKKLQELTGQAGNGKKEKEAESVE
jgi:chaperonin cofactor prefoldin